MFKKAMDELSKLEQSGKPEDELQALAKALELELGLDPLVKSQQEPAAVVDETTVQAAAAAAAVVDEALVKSQLELEDDELVLASEAYGFLQKSVQEGTAATLGEMDVIKKSLGALLNLSIKLAGVVGQMHSDRTEGMERIAKSMETIAAGPMIPNRAVIGTGAVDETLENGELKKSNSEVQDLLMKAIGEGKVVAYHLSAFGTHKDVNRLPQDVRDAIGV